MVVLESGLGGCTRNESCIATYQQALWLLAAFAGGDYCEHAKNDNDHGTPECHSNLLFLGNTKEPHHQPHTRGGFAWNTHAGTFPKWRHDGVGKTAYTTCAEERTKGPVCNYVLDPSS